VVWVRLDLGGNSELRSRLIDSTSLKRTEYYSAASLTGRDGKVSIRFSQAREDRDTGDGWDDYSSAVEGRLEFESSRGQHVALRGGVTHRRVDYAPGAGANDRRLSNGEFHLQLRDVLVINSMTLEYRLANALTSVYGTKLIKVGTGSDYDSLGNYCPGSGQYQLSRYEKHKQPVSTVKANLALEIGRKGKVLIQRRLSSRTDIDIQGESSADRLERIALLSPSYILNDAGMALGRLDFTEELVLRQGRGLTLSLRAKGGKTIDNRCDERRERSTSKELLARLLSNGFRRTTMGLEGRISRTETSVHMGSTRASPKRRTWSTKLSVERNISTMLRTLLRLELLNQDRTEPASRFLQASLAPGFTLFVGALRCDGGLNLRRIIRSETSGAVPSPWRDSVDWNSRAHLRHGRYTSLSLEYTGRKAHGTPTVHNVKAALSATF
jgi:hypothetical protein